ncbi:MAG TPA: chemotaxis protein CheW [Thermoanaerobaculia bacterium]|jgi:purine-binding chemotaxis protein CheW|nr:chemotaxis protein CheW [Thermoanaerobaculia bacterium]
MLPMPSAARVPDRAQYLTFSLAGGEYAIAVLRVREILEHEAVTRVPSTPAFVRGVINLRGSVVAVVDLANKFGLPASPVTKRTCIVIVEVASDGGHLVMGVLADAVNQVVEFAPEDIEAPPSFGTPVRVDFLRGLGKLGGQFVLILDTDRVLSAGELAAVTSAPEKAPAAGAAPAKAAAQGGRA